MKLQVVRFGCAVSAVWGLTLLCVGVANLLAPGYGEALLRLVESIYPGYHYGQWGFWGCWWPWVTASWTAGSAACCWPGCTTRSRASRRNRRRSAGFRSDLRLPEGEAHFRGGPGQVCDQRVDDDHDPHHLQGFLSGDDQAIQKIVFAESTGMAAADDLQAQRAPPTKIAPPSTIRRRVQTGKAAAKTARKRKPARQSKCCREAPRRNGRCRPSRASRSDACSAPRAGLAVSSRATRKAISAMTRQYRACGSRRHPAWTAAAPSRPQTREQIECRKNVGRLFSSSR